MRKSVVVGAIATVPLAAIAIREAARLVAGASDARPAGAPLLWIFGVFVTLTLIWTGVALVGRAGRRDPAKLSFEAVAAIAIAEAKKRPPAARCPRCGRPRVVASAAKCLYCGVAWAAPAPAAGQ